MMPRIVVGIGWLSNKLGSENDLQLNINDIINTSIYALVSGFYYI